MIEAGHKINFNQLFIIGRMRSGTTLLRSILHAHSKICIPPESTFIWDLFPVYGKIQKWSPSIYKNFLRDLNTDIKYNFWKVNDAYLLKRLEELGTNTSFQQVCQTVISCYKNKREPGSILWVGDKNPIYCNYLKHLMRIFPSAKFIYIVRDYRDVLASLWPLELETQWTSAMSYRWNRCQQIFLDMRKEFPDQFFLIKYEDLIRDPKKEMSEVLKFLKLQWEEDLLQFYLHNSKAGLEFSEKLKPYIQNTDQPILKNNTGKWRKNLSENQVAIAESISGDIGEIFGYQTSITSPKAPAGVIVPRVYSKLYFIIEKVSFLLPPRLKRFYLILKRRFEHKWYKKLLSASKELKYKNA